MEAKSSAKTLHNREEQEIKILIIGGESNSLSEKLLPKSDFVKVDAIGNITSEIDVAVFLAKFSRENLRKFKIFKQGKNILAIYVCKRENGFAILAVLESSTQPEHFFDENFNEENLEEYINGYLKFWNLYISSNEFHGIENQLTQVGKYALKL